MKKTRGSVWTHLVRLSSYLWHKRIAPVWWYTDSEQQSWPRSTSIWWGQRLYFKETLPPRWAAEVSGEPRRGELERGKGRKNISLNTKCRYYSCGVLKCTPRRPVVCTLAGGLSWSQLHFQPVEESGVFMGREQRWGDAGMQVLNAKPPVPAKHARGCKHTVGMCECAGVCEHIHKRHAHTHLPKIVQQCEQKMTSIEIRPVLNTVQLWSEHKNLVKR